MISGLVDSRSHHKYKSMADRMFSGGTGEKTQRYHSQEGRKFLFIFRLSSRCVLEHRADTKLQHV